MEYTKKIFNKFFGLIRKDKQYYSYIKDNANNCVISLKYINYHCCRFCVQEWDNNRGEMMFYPKYQNIWTDITNYILYPYWVNKVVEFLEFLDLKEEIERYCHRTYNKRSIKDSIYYASLGHTGKWEGLMDLMFLCGHKDYHIIKSLWYSQSEKRFYYQIKI